MGISEEDLAKYRANVDAARAHRRQPASVPTRGEPPKKPGRSKFARSMPGDRTYDGVLYASKGEMAFAKQLALEWLKNPAMWWVRQPVFDLAGVRYTADFLVIRPEAGPWTGERYSLVTVYEIKPKLKPGRFRDDALRTFRRNAAQVRALWAVDIELVET